MPLLIGGLIVVVIAGAYLPTGLSFLEDCITTPWAHSFRGAPTLTGRWEGQLSGKGLEGRSMQLEIVHNPQRSRDNSEYYSRRGAFNGSAFIVAGDGFKTQYEIWGRSNRDGSKINIHFRETNRRAMIAPQPSIQELNAVWSGDSLVVSGSYGVVVYDGVSESSDSETPPLPITIALKKAESL